MNTFPYLQLLKSYLGSFSVFLFIVVSACGYIAPLPGFAENPKNRIDFWRKNYDELQPKDDPRAARAHEIFQRVLKAAGARPGVVPEVIYHQN